MKNTPEIGVENGSKAQRGELEVEVARSAHQWRMAKEALGREHGLGAGREAGDRVCQLVREDGKLVAVLIWCAAAWHLKDRDELVGWDAVARSRRLNSRIERSAGARSAAPSRCSDNPSSHSSARSISRS